MARKIAIIGFALSLILLFSNCAGLLEAEEKGKDPTIQEAAPDAPALVEKEKPENPESQEAKLPTDDVKKLKLDALTWKFKYLDCLIKNLELAYRARCYQSDRFVEIKRQLNEVNREIRALTVGAPHIKKPESEEEEEAK